MSLVKSKWHGKGKGIRGETSHTFQQKNNQILPWRCAYQKALMSCGPLSHGLPRKNGKTPPMQEKSRRFSGAGAMQEKWSKTRRLLRNAGELTGLGEKLLIKEVKTCQMESVRMKINEHMTSVGEEILCVLEKQQSGDVCRVKLDVRVFVLERLSLAALYICNLFQREMETLHNIELHTAGMSVTSPVPWRYYGSSLHVTPYQAAISHYGQFCSG